MSPLLRPGLLNIQDFNPPLPIPSSALLPNAGEARTQEGTQYPQWTQPESLQNEGKPQVNNHCVLNWPL